ncbi:hypothetical protein M422DRAFT_250276 [Sphaerobolus stellatus SS14]|uniref:PH domain-containing protein n=1 Tax=Sphaerobolus stellatus (strain SS14) TaxID=990650 RepID=A0A0C9VGS3_SPHS4|nr:hypothetical protein M422DRAFT_250276 [Sphaerobolus stellatus SS14]
MPSGHRRAQLLRQDLPEKGLLNGELFAKRNAIVLREHEADDDESLHKEPWLIFFESVTVMEDWYLALLATQQSTPYPLDAHASLIESLDAMPNLIPTRWPNAILRRLMKELSKVRAQPLTPTPPNTLLGQNPLLPQIRRRPLLLTRVRRTRPRQIMLKELTPDGEASIGVNITYNPPPDGEMRITVSALVTILFPKKKEDKPYEVSLMLAVVVKKLVGNMIVRIKKPSSNRMWYAFTTLSKWKSPSSPSSPTVDWSSLDICAGLLLARSPEKFLP